VLGEDLTRFRDASKVLYNFLRAYSWSDKVERLGFDEVRDWGRNEIAQRLISFQVWMDVTDMVDYNLEVLNRNDLGNAFFQLSPTDPTVGFTFDASRVAGHTWPAVSSAEEHEHSSPEIYLLRQRLYLGSHLAMYIRHQLEEQKGYTCTVGISTTKLISKLIGNVNKPKGQTTLMPPFEAEEGGKNNINDFLDHHDIGAIPGVGFKLAQKLREYVLGAPADFEFGLVYGGTRENVTVGMIRGLPELSSEMLEKLLGGPGSPHGIGAKVFGLIYGVDDTEVGPARNVPHQISIEDSYIRLDTMEQVINELQMLSTRLIQRMRIDLTTTEDDEDDVSEMKHGNLESAPKKWMGRPETLRLTTRPRPPLNADGTRNRTFKRISRSVPVPSFMFSLQENVQSLASRVISEALLPLFKKLHPEKSGWNLSLVNVAVTDMVVTASGSRDAAGRDIGKMFRQQNHVLDEWKIKDDADDEGDIMVNMSNDVEVLPNGSITDPFSRYEEAAMGSESEWDEHSDEESSEPGDWCQSCRNTIPNFAKTAHERFHLLNE